jgi:hypothetical protein
MSAFAKKVAKRRKKKNDKVKRRLERAARGRNRFFGSLHHSNILLAQFHDVQDGDDRKLVEYVPEGGDPEKSGRFFKKFGHKIYSIHDHNSRLLTQYDGSKDRTDLSCLRGKEGYFLVMVSKTEYGNFVWKCARIASFDEANEMAVLEDTRECTPEEAAILNEVYPEYLDNAF